MRALFTNHRFHVQFDFLWKNSHESAVERLRFLHFNNIFDWVCFLRMNQVQMDQTSRAACRLPLLRCRSKNKRQWTLNILFTHFQYVFQTTHSETFVNNCFEKVFLNDNNNNNFDGTTSSCDFTNEHKIIDFSEGAFKLVNYNKQTEHRALSTVTQL